MSSIATWERPHWKPGGTRRTRQHFIAFFADACPDFEVHAAEDGLPEGDPLLGFELEAYSNASWIAGWGAGPLGVFLDDAEGVDATAVRQARAAMGACAGKTDGRTLAGLQGGMALCRGFARAGALAVLDVVALRWWSAEALLALAPDRPFDIGEHISLTYETAPEHPEVGNFCHTRGLAKFARPDLGIYGATPGDAGALLSAVASAMARGLDPADGETTRVAGGEVWHFKAHPDDSGIPSPLFFNTWLELVKGPRALLG
ncbi:MAG: hypothetical protein JWM80_1803 [Cyanobacteria bacterium RYN_339]|nr:hypothetical protein [Cyanobacteria bacterium RYN_339]